jgi:hypothetical protein
MRANKLLGLLNQFQPRIYEAEITFKRMYQVQAKEFEGKSTLTANRSMTKTTKESEGIPEDKAVEEKGQVKAVDRDRFVKVKAKKEKTQMLHTIPVNANGKLCLYAGDPWGIFRQDMINAIKAMGRAGYKLRPSLKLITITPQHVEVGEPPVDGIDEILEKRVVVHPVAREYRTNVKYEYIGDGLYPNSPKAKTPRKALMQFEIAPECPLKEVEFLSILDAMRRLPGNGPTARGSYDITGIRLVQAAKRPSKSKQPN